MQWEKTTDERETEGNGKRRRLTQLMKKKREREKNNVQNIYLGRQKGKNNNISNFKMSKKEKTVRIRTFPDIILI